ncbi:MAG TPA: HXXEE domain-containing protein [Pyrinomonadaceae bacterium]|nr:HXXEE domain-containing protein [Pyrinomonadaceae bacterium]
MNYVSRALLFAPFIFVVHFLEESPGFVEWFNGHVGRGITSGLFWTVNISALVITLVLVGIEWSSRSAFSLVLAAAWLGFLMLANAAFHIAGGVLDRQYVPGLVTAIVLYVPYYCWFFMRAAKSRRVAVVWLIAAAIFGSLPMLAHGYLILFRGSRLF